jgi:N-acetylglucosamine kinase-like BadF-type ATPase
LLGDEGSGYRIALAGLQAAVRAADGRGPATSLLGRFEEALGSDSPAGLIERIYAPEMARQQIAALASVVFAASHEDNVAQHLLSQAAEHLAEMVVSLARWLNLDTSSFPLAMAGGVLVQQPAFRERVLLATLSLDVNSAAVQVVPEPVAGAVRIARKT